MNNEYLRMKALLEDMGMSFEEGSITKAEIYAYSKGLELVKNYCTAALCAVLLEDGGDRYAALLDIDASRFTESELKDEVIKRLSMNFGKATVSEFDDEFSLVGSGSYTIEKDDFDDIITTFIGVEAEDLAQLGKFIKGYTSLSAITYFDGHGMDFDSWDRWNQTFYSLDKMALQFNIINTLRSDMIE